MRESRGSKAGMQGRCENIVTPDVQLLHLALLHADVDLLLQPLQARVLVSLLSLRVAHTPVL